VLESGITLIHDGRLYYRGRDAVRISDTATLEEVAALLWEVTDEERVPTFEQACPISIDQLTAVRRCAPDTFARMQVALPVAGGVDLASYDRRATAVRQTGGRILRLLAAVVAGRRSTVPMHRALQTAWSPATPAMADALRAALVLCADHELNVSAFAARCAASAGAAPYDVVSAALATLKGYKHGGVGDEVLALLHESATPARARAAVARRLRKGQRVPGFGHPLYPEGDPRAGALLQRAAAMSGAGKAWRAIQHLRNVGSELTGDHPNLDFGLAALTHACNLPPHAPLLLFALGRTVGWIAHAQEEYAADRLIRPRARYVGPPPGRTAIL
jgi:citrate synthase